LQLFFSTVPAKVTAFIDFLVEWFGREAAWVAAAPALSGSP
jgi:hypothetical protein